MAAEARVLWVPEYEPRAWAAYPSDGDERVLDDETALRLLSGATDPFQSDLDREHVDEIDSEYASDALAPARAIGIGAALVSPFWLLVALMLM